MRRNYSNLEEDDNTEVDMTPMLDIVFIMLIFFIVTTSFVKESGISVNRPEAKTAVKQEKGNIIIAIAAQGEVWINKRPVDLAALRPNVERMHAEAPEASVVITADEKSPNGVLVKVMDQVRLAGITNISLAADEGK